MHFSYFAKKVSGQEIRGVMEAKDKFDLARILRKQGYMLISSKDEDAKKKKTFRLPAILGRVSVSEKMFFSKNLSVMVSAGVSVARALEILSRQTKNKKFKTILNSIADSIKRGNSLSESMKDYPRVFSSLFVAMVRVGEETGKLSESLNLIGEQLERDHALRKRVRGAMMYPSIIIMAMIIIGILMLIYVVPTLVSTFEELGVELPISTKVVISISGFITSHPILFFAIIIAILSLIGWFFGSKKGKRIIANTLLRLPVFSGLVKKINSARTSRTLASLISSGVDVLQSLSITRDVLQNYKYKEILESAKKDIEKGEPISKSFKASGGLYPVLMGEMISVGEETGKISEMLLRLAVFYEEEVTETTKNLSTIIEPLLMIVIGVIVGFFAISMIKPMYSMVGGL